MSVLGDILGGVGTVLSAPRRLLYEGIISPLTGTDVKGFGDVLTNMGMEDSFAKDALGFVGDVATDPLTYAGGFLAKKAINSLGRVSGDLGRASGAGKGLAVKPVVKDAVAQTPTFDGLRYASAMPGAAGKVVKTPGLTTVHTSVGDDALALRGHMSGGSKMTGDPVSLMERVKGSYPNQETLGQIGGLQLPGDKAIFVRYARPMAEEAGEGAGHRFLQTRRHERFHDLVEQAKTNPELMKQLPFTGRMAARLEEASPNFVKGVGRIFNEMGAAGVESRGMLQSLKNQAGVLLNPETNAFYSQYLGRLSPALGTMYGSLPSAFVRGSGVGLHSLGEMLS